MQRSVVGLTGGLICVLGAFAAGRSSQDAAMQPRHAALLNGADWAAYSPREKEAYLSGFIAGAGAEQTRALAALAGDSLDSSAVSSSAITRLRDGKQLRFSYAPSVYAAQIDDFYWWVDHRQMPIVDVLVTINRQMKDR
jgi:hypothetical protein